METFFETVGFVVLAATALVILGAILLWAFPPARLTMSNLLMRAAATVGAGLYALSPIDLIPDFIPLLGQLDDIGVILLLVMYWLALFKDEGGKSLRDRPASDRVIDIKPVD